MNMMSTKERLTYPKARRYDTVIDIYHGVEVPDPYRWLETPDSDETKAFIEAQNSLTASFVDSGTVRPYILTRLQELNNSPAFTIPSRHGEKYYFFENKGARKEDILYVQDNPYGRPRVFYDPNNSQLAGTICRNEFQFSHDGSIIAYQVTTSGSDWMEIYFANTEIGENYPEVLKQVKLSNISWTHDNLGIFYARYPYQEFTEGVETDSIDNQKVYYHRVGTPQYEDVLVVEFPENPDWLIDAEVSDCGRWLIVMTAIDIHNNLVYFSKLDPENEINGQLKLIPLVDKLDANYEYVTNDGTKAIFKTNKSAPNYTLIAIDLLDFRKNNWTVLIPEHPRKVLQKAFAVNKDKLIVVYIQGLKDIMQLFSLKTGKLIKNIPLDGGTIVEFFGDKKYSDVYFKLSSYLNPGTIYRMDLQLDGNPKIYRKMTTPDFDSSLYQETEVSYTSMDGTKVPMIIVMRKGAELNGSMPALLYGYGGFGKSIRPHFDPIQLIFIQHLNGVYAVAGIRGGGEYGQKWHDEGRLLKKQNSLNDFQSAAEYLIEEGYTTNRKLTIRGVSNGGNLVASCMNQRPDLFGAVIASVGLMDMLRYQKFTIGYLWAAEYGNSDDPEHFETLIDYSPLHNIEPPIDGGQYPATFLLAGDHDDCVVPLHSLKFIATLQHEIGQLPQQKSPLLLKVFSKTGHGVPSSQKVEEFADILVFIVNSLGLTYKDGCF